MICSFPSISSFSDSKAWLSGACSHRNSLPAHLLTHPLVHPPSHLHLIKTPNCPLTPRCTQPLLPAISQLPIRVCVYDPARQYDIATTSWSTDPQVYRPTNHPYIHSHIDPLVYISVPFLVIQKIVPRFPYPSVHLSIHSPIQTHNQPQTSHHPTHRSNRPPIIH